MKAILTKTIPWTNTKPARIKTSAEGVPAAGHTAEDAHTFAVTVSGCDYEQARQVLAERLGHDEDYGFPYTLNF